MSMKSFFFSILFFILLQNKMFIWKFTIVVQMVNAETDSGPPIKHQDRIFNGINLVNSRHKEFDRVLKFFQKRLMILNTWNISG